MSKWSDEFESSYIDTKNIRRITNEFKKNKPKEATRINKILGKYNPKQLKGGKK